MTKNNLILVIDDEPANLQVIVDYLRTSSFDVRVSRSGEKGLERARYILPDLILLDVVLPGIDGFETCRRLKADELTKHIPVLFMTILTDVTDKVEGFDAGGADYITKPIQQAELLARILTHLKLSKLQNYLENQVEIRTAKLAQANLRLQTEIAERERAEQETRRRNRELLLLNRIIAASHTDLEPEEILKIVCRELVLAFHTSGSAATLHNHEEKTTTIVAQYDTEGRSSVLHHTVPLEMNELATYIIKQKAPFVVTDVEQDQRLDVVRDLLRMNGTKSLLMVPLMIDKKAVGTLGMDTTYSHQFTPEQVSLIQNVASQVSGVLVKAQLNQERRLLGAAIEQSIESIMITDFDGRILYVNSGFEKITGYNRIEALGKTPQLLRSDKHSVTFYQELRGTIKDGQTWYGRIENKKKNGTLYTEEASINPICGNSGTITHFVQVGRDITQELLLEQQYRQTQKMEVLGQFTAGVAHDFNNILTVINGYSEILINSYQTDNDPRVAKVEHIRKAAQQATRMTYQLLAFSRQQPIHFQPLNLNQVVKDLDDMLRYLIGKRMELNINLAPNLGDIMADSGQMEQIIINLVVNASDATPEKGKLTLKTDNIVFGKNGANRILNLEPGPYSLLSITDTGIGMSEETQSHIFEPFYTTKTVGKGTGLGLAIVYGIIEQNHGHIEVESKLGQGTIFRIYLPQIKQTVKPISPTKIPQSETLDGNETILLVEDEPSVRLITRKLLEKQGYTVLETDQADKAIQICQQEINHLDLLITDVVMPDLNGRN